MKIAIHDRAGSFSDRWLKYCDENQIPYKRVNCYAYDIVSQLVDCSGLMWHWDQNDYKAALFARQLSFSLEKKGMKIFPDVNSSWHYDDKVGQKYLLEALNAPLVKSYVFYSRQNALDWANKITFPKVFKLRVGAGSVNVSLAKTKEQARRLIEIAFNKGFSHINRLSRFKNTLWVLKKDKNLTAVKRVLTGFARLFIPIEKERFSCNEKGYIYFQDFIPGNDYDTRLIVVGNRCFGARRYCRKGDFRASGSGILKYEPKLIDKKSIQIAFETAKKAGLQSVAFDFIMEDQSPKIIEISYCFPMGPMVDKCPGYWDEALVFHNVTVNPQYFMVEDFIESLASDGLSSN